MKERKKEKQKNKKEKKVCGRQMYNNKRIIKQKQENILFKKKLKNMEGNSVQTKLWNQDKKKEWKKQQPMHWVATCNEGEMGRGCPATARHRPEQLPV